MVSRADILRTAETYVTKDRAATHGSAEDNFNRIAALWNAYLEPQGSITAVDVAVMMTLLKVARIGSNESYEDNWIDACGYMACGGEIAMAPTQPLSGALSGSDGPWYGEGPVSE